MAIFSVAFGSLALLAPFASEAGIRCRSAITPPDPGGVIVFGTNPDAPNYHQEIRNVDLHGNIEHVAITSDGTRIYATNEGLYAINVFQTSDFSILSTPYLDNLGHVEKVATYGMFAVVTLEQESDNLKVIDTNPDSATYNRVVVSITAACSPEGLSVRGDEALIAITDEAYGRVALFRTDYQLAAPPAQVGNVPEAVAFSPDGKVAYATNQGSNDVSIIDTDDSSETFGQVILASLPVGESPEGIAFDPSGTYAYVANFGGSVSVIDTSARVVVNTINMDGSFPYGVAAHPDGSRVYVTTSDEQGQVAAIYTSDWHVEKIPLPGARFVQGITDDGERAYVANDVPPF
jgi:YVTN family beta-propeller protein